MAINTQILTFHGHQVGTSLPVYEFLHSRVVLSERIIIIKTVHGYAIEGQVGISKHFTAFRNLILDKL